MSDSQQEIVAEVQVMEVAAEPAEKPIKDKKALTHRLSRAQLEDIGRNLMVPQVVQAQISEKIGDKNSERNKRPRNPNNTRGNVHMEMENVIPVPVPSQNNGIAQQPAPQPVAPAAPAPKGVIPKMAAVPYGRAAAKGALFGASAAAAGSLVFFGGRWVIRKIQGSPTV